MAGLMDGKTALVFGVANHRSVAWAIAQALAGAGARLAFAYQERVERYVRELADTLTGSVLERCDVSNDDDIDRVFASVESELGGLDVLIHSLAYAERSDIDGRFVDTSRDGWRVALEVSAYSLAALARRAEPLMESGERVVPNYNVMGVAKAALDCCVRYLAADLGPKNIRVNAISAGPMRTLAARAIADFSTMERHVEERSPLRRNIEQREVGDAALFLCSPLGRAITGEVLHVDSGYHVMGM